MNAALVKIDVAAATLGWHVGKLFDLADGGTLLDKPFMWVFNLANNAEGERRDLRWWLPEVMARASADPSKHDKYCGWELDWVLAQVLPPRIKNFQAGAVDQLFQIRPRTRIDLHHELAGVKGSSGHSYERAALAAFLSRRWLASQTISPQRTASGSEARTMVRVSHVDRPLADTTNRAKSHIPAGKPSHLTA